jgi:hypothetical protein
LAIAQICSPPRSIVGSRPSSCSRPINGGADAKAFAGFWMDLVVSAAGSGEAAVEKQVKTQKP